MNISGAFFRPEKGCAEMSKVIKFSQLAFHIALPLAAGGISGILVPGGREAYAAIPKPPFSPPALMFTVLWAVFYALMGVGAYLAAASGQQRSRLALKFYYAQLGLSVIWAAVFFQFYLYTLGVAVIITQWVLLCAAIMLFSLLHRFAPLLLMPYALYITYAAYMNMGAAMLSR